MERDYNAREMHAVEMLAALDSQLACGIEVLRERMKLVPDSWRKYKLAQKSIESVLDGLYETAPMKTLVHMQRLCKNGEVIIRPKQVVDLNDVQIVQTNDLRVLINKTMEANCAMCLERGGNVRSCKIRKSLMCIAPPDKVFKDGSCPYQSVAASNDLGEYI